MLVSGILEPAFFVRRLSLPFPWQRSMEMSVQPNELLLGCGVAFVGSLGGVTRQEAKRIVKRAGGVSCKLPDSKLNLVVLGADEMPDGDPLDQLTADQRLAVEEGRIEVIDETQFWEKLGLVDAEQNVHRLYTPAMLAQLLEISVAKVRNWYRRGLLIPVREVHQLPYFNFQEISIARHLLQLTSAGASTGKIVRHLQELSERHPDVDRPLSQLSVLVDGKQILIRQGSELVEPGGQIRMDFEALETNQEVQDDPRTIDLTRFRLDRLSEPGERAGDATAEELLSIAAQLEEQDQIEAAIEAYRSYLVGFGATFEVCFLLAELLYRVGDLNGARERYYMAIELNEGYVEARANLGCVLVELGDLELALAAFRGALRYHPDYPDVHFHIARTLDRLGEDHEAEQHWKTFLRLAPESPWADEARQRLSSKS